MKYRRAIFACIIAIAAVVPHVFALRVMPWMCLERCGESIQSDLDGIRAHAQDYAAVSFEAYDLRDNAAFVDNGFTRVGPTLAALGLELHPMITTAKIDRLRALFSSPDQFVSDAVSAAVQHNFTGYNVDFEPCQDGASVCTADDAAAYAKFLTQFADALHAHGKVLSVDVASWSPFWDFGAIAATPVDKIITMDTYASSWDYFQSHLQKAVSAFGLDRLGVGLCSDCFTISVDAVQQRMQLIRATGAKEVDIWQAPVPETWWPLLRD